MRIETVVSVPDQQVSVDLCIEDITAAMAEGAPESVHWLHRGISNCWQYLKAVPDSLIDEMTPEARLLSANSLREQADRFAKEPK